MEYGAGTLRAKGPERIQVNNMMSAVGLGVLSLLLSVSVRESNAWLIGQVAASVPLLATSSLGYAKTLYRPANECKYWDTFGWFMHSLGYGLLLNGVALMLADRGYGTARWVFMCVVVALFVWYSVLDVVLNRRRLGERLAKLAFYLLVLVLGGYLPARH